MCRTAPGVCGVVVMLKRCGNSWEKDNLSSTVGELGCDENRFLQEVIGF